MKKNQKKFLWSIALCVQFLIIGNALGQVANYSFTSSSGTYVAISGGTVSSSGSGLDDGIVSVTLPASFVFNGTTITTVGFSPNGYLILGNATSHGYTPISSTATSSGVISAFGVDLVANATTTETRWEQIGSEIIFQWKHFRRYLATPEQISFQIRLNTSNGQINIVYDGSSTIANSIDRTPQVGLRGSANSDFNARRLTTSIPTATPSWSNTTAASSNAHNVRFTSGSPAAFPSSGLTFTWIPPTPCSGTPTAGSIASNTSQNICSGSTPASLSVTGSSSGVTGITYQWEQSTDNASWSNATGGTGATTTTYAPPSFGGTTIYYRCKVLCSNSSLSDVTNVATIAPPSNPTTQATNLAFSSISYTGFTASWSNGNGNRRVVFVSDAAITDPTNSTGASALTANATYSGTGQKIVYDGTGTSVTVTGLNLATTYYVKVIEYTRCGSSTYDYYYNVSSGTNSSSVTTIAASPVPWTENFSTTTLPLNWFSNFSTLSTTTALDPAVNSNYIYHNFYSSSTTKNFNTPILGSIPTNYRFTVKYKLANFSSSYAPPASGSGNFIVAISTNNGTSYSDVETIANNAVAGWQDYTLNLSAYVGQNIRIRITGNWTSGDYYLAFDEFKIEAIPSCLAPSLPTISAITNAGATLSWTAPSTAPGSGYEVYYSTTNTAPTAGTTPTETVTTGTSLAIAGLTANTTYYAWVRSNCGSGDVSAWVASASFKTSCDPISSLPWTEGFESISSIGTTEFPDCWVESTGTYWTSLDAAEDSYNDPRTGDKYIGCDYGVADQRIWTPGFQLTAGVSYDFSTYFVGDGYSGWDGSILSNTSQSGTGETVLGSPFISSSTTTLDGTDYTLIKRSFIPSTSGVYYFGIKISANYVPYGYIGFDDFKLDLTPAPTITTVISSVACGGSTLVTISGTNLSSASSVKIGGTTISPLTINSATQITATVTTAFSGTVEVVTASGTATSASSISYTTAPILTINTTTQTNCSNVSNGSLTTITSTVGDFDTYTWSPTTGVTGDATSGWSFNPTATTSYMLTASNSSGCSNTISKSITVNSAPSAITLTPVATTGVCLGDVKSIVASGGNVDTSLPNYTFSSVSGTFTPITGGTSVSAIQTDDIISSAIPIGFTFNYNGSTYSNVYPSSNGILSLNSSAPSNLSAANGLTSVSSSIAPIIAPLWDDLDGTTGSASYLTSGTVGNRIFTFEWLNWEWNYSANAAVISFQVKLYEATGKVEFVYRQEGNAVNTNSSGASIGLTGSTGTYWSLNNSSSTPTASKTSETSTIVTKPATGQIYSFTPPPTPTKSWSPTATLFIDAAATTAYAGNPTTVYAKPTANTTYTATATNTAGCSVSSSVTFNVTTPSSMALAANDYVWRGKVDTDWNTASNWVVYDGTNYATATTVPTATQNIYIPQNGVCVVNQPNTGTNNIASSLITIEPSATLTMGSGTLAVSGNFVNNGTFVPGTGTVKFNGSVAQTITGTTTFNNLSLDNTAGLTLNNSVTVSNTLTMTAGNISTSAINLLTLGNNAPATITWTSGKVVGPMKRWMAAATNSGNTSSLFPIGTASRNAKVNLEYTTAPTTAGYLVANFINGDPTSAVAYPVPLTDQYNYLLENIDSHGYWEIAPSSVNGVVGGIYTLTLQADNISPIVDYQNYRIIKSPMPHTDWILQGTHLAGSGSNSDFTVSRTNMSDFSFFALASPLASILPTELVSFAANCEDNNTISVNWSTASEHNSDYFIVEKSRDGSTWNVLKTIQAAGNSTQLINYTVSDVSDITGTVYFRLSQYDIDGTSKVYDIVSTNCSTDKELTLLAYPNPSNGQFTVKIENVVEGSYTLGIIDLQGKMIEEQAILLETGTTILKLNPIGLKPGVYLLQFIQNGNVLQQQKLVIE